MDARDGVHDEVAAELGGIIDVDAQAGFDAGADDERRGSSCRSIPSAQIP